jgi:hypothetical protein
LKSFEFILEPRGNSFRLRIVERGYDYLDIFGRDGAFMLLLAVDTMARVDNSANFLRKFRDPQSAFLVQQCSNSHRSYMAIEEFNGFERILIPGGKKKWSWCGFVEVL